MLAYNENGVLQVYEEYERTVTCPSCGKKYRQEITEQVPGFRDKDYDVCPYCHSVNGSSMEVEFMNYAIE